MTGAPKAPVVYLSAITSDIGIAIAKRYAADGYVVTGTYRSTELLGELKGVADGTLDYCDLADVATIRASVAAYAARGLAWETFISCASWPPPLSGFFEGDFEDWSRSVHVNAIEQLRVLHALYPYRDRRGPANVVFFGGPGTNTAVKHFSALTVSKLVLLKMCELLDAETDDLNVFIVGPGWVRTKTHDLILGDPHVSPAKREETLRFLNTQTGTSMDDIYRCIRWASAAGRPVAGGRNFSVVHDEWGSDELAAELRRVPDMYKMRRHGNAWRERGTR